MINIELLLDTIEGSTCPESINLGGTDLWNFQGRNYWSLPTILEFGSRNMTAHKLHNSERSDNKVRELASRLSLEEQVCSKNFSTVNLSFYFPSFYRSIGIGKSQRLILDLTISTSSLV